MERLGSTPHAEQALQRVYRQWFELAPQEREYLSPARPWLTRLVDRVCSDIVRSAPDAAGAETIGMAPLMQGSTPGPGMRPSAPTQDRDADIVAIFALACRADHRLALDAVLAPAVIALVDAGGRLRIDPSPAHGVEDVSHLVLSLLGGRPDLVMTAQSVNGRTGLVARHGIAVVAVVSLDVVDGRVHQVCIVLNPDKLRSWNRD